MGFFSVIEGLRGCTRVFVLRAFVLGSKQPGFVCEIGWCLSKSEGEWPGMRSGWLGFERDLLGFERNIGRTWFVSGF